MINCMSYRYFRNEDVTIDRKTKTHVLEDVYILYRVDDKKLTAERYMGDGQWELDEIGDVVGSTLLGMEYWYEYTEVGPGRAEALMWQLFPPAPGEEFDVLNQQPDDDTKTLTEVDDILCSVERGLAAFEERCSEEFQATDADWELWQNDWKFIVFAYLFWLVRKAERLPPEQKEHLSALILRARGHKEEILQHEYAYPEVIDQNYEWMPELMSGTPEEKTILQNKYVLLSMSISLDEVEELCSGKRLVAQHDWDHGLGDWKTLLYDRITPLLENAAVLTAEQREKLADIIRRTRAIKDQILAHNYPYPEEVDQDYAWMKG